MMDYNVDWGRWVRQMLPIALRRQVIITLLLSGLRPLIALYAWWRGERLADLERLRGSGQVCHIRSALERHLPSAQRVRYTVGTAPRRHRMIYALSEVQRGVLVAQRGRGPVSIEERLEARGHNIIEIGVPTDVYDKSLHEVEALVLRLRLPSKQVEYTKI